MRYWSAFCPLKKQQRARRARVKSTPRQKFGTSQSYTKPFTAERGGAAAAAARSLGAGHHNSSTQRPAVLRRVQCTWVVHVVHELWVRVNQPTRRDVRVCARAHAAKCARDLHWRDAAAPPARPRHAAAAPRVAVTNSHRSGFPTTLPVCPGGVAPERKPKRQRNTSLRLRLPAQKNSSVLSGSGGRQPRAAIMFGDVPSGSHLERTPPPLPPPRAASTMTAQHEPHYVQCCCCCCCCGGGGGRAGGCSHHCSTAAALSSLRRAAPAAAGTSSQTPDQLTCSYAATSRYSSL
jgi:hypothetical protein